MTDPAGETVVIICHCGPVSDRSVSDAVSAGARTLAQVCRATNAGHDCGACVFSVRRVMTDQLQRATGPVMAASSA